MISYHILDNQEPDTMNSCDLIEKVRKCYAQPKKCHRSIDDSERKYINNLIDKRAMLQKLKMLSIAFILLQKC